MRGDAMARKTAAKPKYLMTVTGQLFKHLGLQMYSGAIPAIAELVSNADGAKRMDYNSSG
jgi:hypothetical protein